MLGAAMEIGPPGRFRLRACIRIGELNRDLETAQGIRNELLPNGEKKSKEQILADAGISTSTANRYEQLAGGKEKQAQDVSKNGGGLVAEPSTQPR